MIQLRPVRFVGKTYDVGPIIDQSQSVIFAVTKFLNSADVKAAALAQAQLLPQMVAALYDGHVTEVQKLLALGE